MSETQIHIIIIFFIFEILEVNWQKGQNILEILLHNHSIYQSKGIFLFFIKHYAFIFLCYIVVIYPSFTTTFIFLLKFLDIAYKLIKIKKINKYGINYINENLITQGSITNISSLKYVSAFVYSLFLFISFL
jgi:hypothetical protein